jgi:hypothetical protein
MLGVVSLFYQEEYAYGDTVPVFPSVRVSKTSASSVNFTELCMNITHTKLETPLVAEDSEILCGNRS